MAWLTQKEILELNDRLMEHAALIEKYGAYSAQSQDQQLRELVQRHQGIFQRHYNEMRSFLQRAQGAIQTGQRFGTQQAGAFTGPSVLPGTLPPITGGVPSGYPGTTFGTMNR
ncbi:MAG: hypothetical protein HYY09_05925 [Firmicutes bacterium]|nr:hypothetical protein [Bacillota bacterium]